MEHDSHICDRGLARGGGDYMLIVITALKAADANLYEVSLKN